MYEKKSNLPSLVSIASAVLVLLLEKQKAFTHTSSLSYEAHLCGHPNETLLREPPALALKGGNLARILGLAAVG